MKRRIRLSAICALAVAGTMTLVAVANEPQNPGQRKLKFKDFNLVFVSFDALQARHVGCLGYHRNITPTIDTIAESGFNFTRNMSVSSWTVPASMTWFTGVYPSEHRMTNKYAVYTSTVKKFANLKELSPGVVTLAEILRDNGYATGGFTGNAGVNGGFGYQQGFDVYHHPKETFGTIGDSVPKALQWLKRNRDRRFFLFLHGYDVHGQATPRTGFDYRFVKKGYDKKYTGTELEQELLREEGLDKGKLTLRAQDVQFWRAIYDEKIQRTDEFFRAFMLEFKSLGLDERTILVLTADHGTELYEHRRFDHGFTLYNELLHVPLVIRLPNRAKGARISNRVSSIDVMPTILDLLDVDMTKELKQQLRGTSLVSAMQGQRAERDVYSETDYRAYTYKRSVITPDGWKLIYTLEDNTRELYHLPSDSKEIHNLAGTKTSKADELQEKLFAHFRSIGHDLTAKKWKVGLKPVYKSQGE